MVMGQKNASENYHSSDQSQPLFHMHLIHLLSEGDLYIQPKRTDVRSTLQEKSAASRIKIAVAGSPNRVVTCSPNRTTVMTMSRQTVAKRGRLSRMGAICLA